MSYNFLDEWGEEREVSGWRRTRTSVQSIEAVSYILIILGKHQLLFGFAALAAARARAAAIASKTNIKTPRRYVLLVQINTVKFKWGIVILIMVLSKL